MYVSVFILFFIYLYIYIYINIIVGTWSRGCASIDCALRVAEPLPRLPRGCAALGCAQSWLCAFFQNSFQSSQ